MSLKDALNTLTSTYQSLDLVAVGLVVDPKEVAEALAKTPADSAEGVALKVLAKLNPYTPSKKVSAPKTEITKDELPLEES